MMTEAWDYRLERRTIKGIRVYRVVMEGIPERTYIIDEQYGREMLFKPWMAGEPLQATSLEAMKNALKVAAELVPLSETPQGEVVEVILLSGGLYYHIERAFQKVFGEQLPINFLGIKRHPVGDDGDFTAEVTYKNFEAMPETGRIHLLTGDTVATGSSVEAAYAAILEDFQHRSGLEWASASMFSLGGSGQSLELFKRLEDRVREVYPTFHMNVFYSTAALDMKTDGTTLSFLGPHAVHSVDLREEVIEALGPYVAERQCRIGDWGNRNKNPRGYIEELEGEVERLAAGSPDTRSREVIDQMREQLALMKQRLARPLNCRY